MSFQLGWSHESYFKNTQAGLRDPTSGGSGLYVHPTIVWGPGGRFLVFAMVSLPVVQDYASPASRNRWGVGPGLVYLFGT